MPVMVRAGASPRGDVLACAPLPRPREEFSLFGLLAKHRVAPPAAATSRSSSPGASPEAPLRSEVALRARRALRRNGDARRGCQLQCCDWQHGVEQAALRFATSRDRPEL